MCDADVTAPLILGSRIALFCCGRCLWGSGHRQELAVDLYDAMKICTVTVRALPVQGEVPPEQLAAQLAAARRAESPFPLAFSSPRK